MMTRFLMTMLVGGFAVLGEAAEPPQIKFDNMVYDFGAIDHVPQVQGTFTFSNAGGGELIVQKPAPTCGCTVAAVRPERLNPGDKGDLVFTLSLPQSGGHIEKHINVPSNDPKTPIINLTIKADIKQTFVVQPSTVLLNDLREGQTTNITVTVTRTDAKLNITKVETLAKFLSTKVVPDDKSDGKSAKIIIEAKAAGLARRFAEAVKVYVDDQPQPRFTISVIGRVMGDFSVTPEQLIWIVQDPADWPGKHGELASTRRLLISAQPTTAKPLEIRNATSSLKELILETVAVETGKTYMVVAKLPQSPKETITGIVTFETTLPNHPKIEVPVTINVMKR